MENNAVKTGHPKGLYFLFFTEMWERFSYYGMRAIFILFMTKVLLMKDADASEIYGSYTGLVYLTPLLGGYLCDKFLGNRRYRDWRSFNGNWSVLHVFQCFGWSKWRSVIS